MEKIVLSTVLGYFAFLYQAVDPLILLDRYGFPIAVCAVSYWFFTKQLMQKTKAERETQTLLHTTLLGQLEYLRQLADRKSDFVCRFNGEK